MASSVDTNVFTPSEQVSMLWPDEFVTIDPTNSFGPSGDDSALNNEDLDRRRIRFRPQVTVNVFSSGGSGVGGSSAGGSGVGGSGTGGRGMGGAATINESGDRGGGVAGGDAEFAVESLASQLADLTKRVEQLSQAQGLLIESGRWSTNDVRHWQHARSCTSGRVEFSKKFTTAPTVTVGICGTDVSNGANLRLKVYATDIDVAGCTIHADSWADTEVFILEVSWTAVGT